MLELLEIRQKKEWILTCCWKDSSNNTTKPYKKLPEWHMLLSNCHHKRTEIIFHKNPRDSMAACSMVNDTFLKKGKRKGRERRKRQIGFTSLGYLYTVNMKPSSPPEQEGHPNLFMNCPTRPSSPEISKLFCILCMVSFWSNQKNRIIFYCFLKKVTLHTTRFLLNWRVYMAHSSLTKSMKTTFLFWHTFCIISLLRIYKIILSTSCHLNDKI